MVGEGEGDYVGVERLAGTGPASAPSNPVRPSMPRVSARTMETIQQTFDKLPVSMVLATPGTGAR